MIQNLVTFVNVTVIGTWCQRGDKRLGDKRLADPTPIVQPEPLVVKHKDRKPPRGLPGGALLGGVLEMSRSIKCEVQSFLFYARFLLSMFYVQYCSYSICSEDTCIAFVILAFLCSVS